MLTTVREKNEVGTSELEKARKMVKRVYEPLREESARRGVKEGLTIHPSALCPGQGKDVVRGL